MYAETRMKRVQKQKEMKHSVCVCFILAYDRAHSGHTIKQLWVSRIESQIDKLGIIS